MDDKEGPLNVRPFNSARALGFFFLLFGGRFTLMTVMCQRVKRADLRLGLFFVVVVVVVVVLVANRLSLWPIWSTTFRLFFPLAAIVLASWCRPILSSRHQQQQTSIVLCYFVFISQLEIHAMCQQRVEPSLRHCVLSSSCLFYSFLSIF